MKKLTAAQWQLLEYMAGGATLTEMLGGYLYVYGDNVPRKTRAPRWETKHALDKAGYIAQVPKEYLPRYKITKKGEEFYESEKQRREALQAGDAPGGADSEAPGSPAGRRPEPEPPE